MKIDNVLEVLNEALASKDLTIWLQKEEIKKQKETIEKLQEKIKFLEEKKDW